MKPIVKLSTDFSKHIKQDIGKKCIYVSKVILQGLSVWPDNNDFYRTAFFLVAMVNLSLMEMGHIAYQIGNFTDIGQMAATSTTVFTTFETIMKLATMVYYKDTINYILVSIWKIYWPAKLVNERRLRYIRSKSYFVIGMSCTFLSMAYISNNHFMAFPLIEGIRMLPCASIFPFDYTVSPIYEIMYLWQWFNNQIVITTLSSVDSLFMALVMNCVFQFIILQDLFENVGLERGREQWRMLYSDGLIELMEYDEMTVVVKYIQHHKMLIRICRDLQNVFSHMIAMQFGFSTLAICVSTVALTADPSLLPHMTSYVIAHVLQLFYYCAVGTELIWESKELTTSVFESNWHLSDSIDLRKAIINIIQRASHELYLTGSGFVVLSLQGFLKSIQLSFSFYTLLDSFIHKK